MSHDISEESDNDYENQIFNHNQHNVEQNEDIMEANETQYETLTESEEMNARYGMRTSNYNLRPQQFKDYSHLHVTFDHVVMTQWSLKSHSTI